jgi:hypothetical protein
MTTPTIEDVARTICLAAWEHDYTPRNPPHADVRWGEAMRAAKAVIEKHFGPMLAEAFRNGQAFEVDQRQPNAYMPRITPEMYAARIIEQMKEQP